MSPFSCIPESTLRPPSQLCRYTLEAGVLDTYADSNTRERRPYEADGLIAGSARLMVQRSAMMWSRHSHSYMIANPTWPIEWQQMTPNLAWADYQATGSTDLFKAYMPRLFNNTFWPQHKDERVGLLNTTWAGGSHIVGWDPLPNQTRFKSSDYEYVSNAYAARGLAILAQLANASGVGYEKHAAAFGAMAKGVRAAMMEHMWDKKKGHYCDGICADPVINGTSGEYTDMYSLYLGFVPPKSSPAVWAAIASAGLEYMGDYGAYTYQAALSDFDEFGAAQSGNVEANGGGDDGTAMLHALTKCDDTSWCAMWQKYNATMTREAFPLPHLPQGQTMSHPWGTAAIPAVVQVLLLHARMLLLVLLLLHAHMLSVLPAVYAVLSSHARLRAIILALTPPSLPPRASLESSGSPPAMPLLKSSHVWAAWEGLRFDCPRSWASSRSASLRAPRLSSSPIVCLYRSRAARKRRCVCQNRRRMRRQVR
jgi:hypothetical protein